ncbi:MAG: 2'-5' RNA ligase [Bacteroidetes bacterium OLB9]|nr:MAG: 2'-5' RNA ligase [Bacteroidetes bacterium OLB9]
MKSLYMAAIEPPSDLANAIRHLQEEFANLYGSAAALKPPVHITFSPPIHLDNGALQLYSGALKEVSGRAAPMVLQLNGFGFFIKNKVVFISVMPHLQLNTLHQDFESQWYNNHDLPTYRPHITIGYRNLDTATFKKIMKDYSARTFNSQFEVNAIHLWQHIEGRWNTIETMPFKTASSHF